jgi:hypothetical protein
MRWGRYNTRGYIGVRPSGFQSVCKLPLNEFLCWYYACLSENILRALARVPKERKFNLVYEELVNDFPTVWRRVMEFIGSNFPEDYIRKTAQDVRTGAIGKFKEVFDDREIAEIIRYFHKYGLEG